MKAARVFMLLTFCSYSIAPAPAHAVSCFGKPINFSTGNSPGQVVVGDFNNDGNLDFVVSYQGDCTSGPGADIFLGNGNRGFNQSVIGEIDADPYSITTGDFNGDGNLDLAAALGGCGGAGAKLEVALGNGDGTFQPMLIYYAGHEPSGVAAGDFNGDGKVDLIVGDAYQGNHLFLAGNGDGTFRPGKVIPSVDGLTTSWNATAADFNGDGKLDFAYTGASQVVVQLGAGDGTFDKFFVYSTAESFPNLAVGDLNRDHKPDVVALSSGLLTVFLGNGDGSLTQGMSYSVSVADRHVAISDLNKNGIADLVVGDLVTPPDLKVFKGLGDGTFPHETSVPSSTGADYVAVGDFNNDGLPDIVTSNVGRFPIGKVVVLLNTGQCH